VFGFIDTTGSVRLGAVLLLQWRSTWSDAKDVAPLRLLAESRFTQSTPQHTIAASDHHWIVEHKKISLKSKPNIDGTLKLADGNYGHQMLYKFNVVSAVIFCDVPKKRMPCMMDHVIFRPFSRHKSAVLSAAFKRDCFLFIMKIALSQ